MHTQFIYNYLHICGTRNRPRCVVPRLQGTFLETQRGVRLVDPRQLLHNLNDLVHCGFTLHAAAVIDLKLNVSKQLDLDRRHTLRTGASKEREDLNEPSKSHFDVLYC